MAKAATYRISGELAPDWTPEDRKRRILKAFDVILQGVRQERQKGKADDRR